MPKLTSKLQHIIQADPYNIQDLICIWGSPKSYVEKGENPLKLNKDALLPHWGADTTYNI